MNLDGGSMREGVVPVGEPQLVEPAQTLIFEWLGGRINPVI
jgi:hypothetical protein